MSTSETTLQQDSSITLGQQPTSSAKVPVLGEGFQETTSKPLSKSAQNSDVDEDAGDTTGDGGAKGGKRRLFGFGKKKDKKKDEPVTASSAPNSKTPIVQPVAQRAPVSGGSPSRPNHPYRNPSSPSNGNFYSSSPRIVSPAGSQIFERDVQESAVPVPASPAIPSHIQTENHIPAVLDASSEAITNNTLDPDSVEIVMHSSHQPAAMTVSGVGSSDVTGGSWTDELLAHPDKDDAASNYGALDSTDVRRLSFISFADVVQSEHAEHAGSRDSIYLAGLNSLSSNRSPSPVRSPVSSQGFNTSPPTSKSASIKGVDMSPGRKPLSLTNIHNLPSPTGGGELTIETMTQALRRTGSGDLSGARSLPLSPVSPDAMSDGPFR